MHHNLITILIIIALFIVGFPSNLLAQKKSILTISIDERIETIYAVAFLDNYFLVSNHESIHKQKLRKNKDYFKQLKVVALFDSLSKKYNFTYYRPVEWILQFSNFPEFKKVKTIADNSFLVTDGKENLLENFRRELIKFNKDTVFQNYLKEVENYNKEMIAQVSQSIIIKKLPSYLEAYYGTKLDSYNLILSPYLHSGGFNAELINTQKKHEVYALIGPHGEIYYTPYFDSKSIETDLILHEFGHSFINPLIEKHKEDVTFLKNKYYNEKLQEAGRSEGNGSWYSVFDELVLRAATIKITEQVFGEKQAKKLLNYEKKIGYTLVETITDYLKKFDENRAIYPTFSDYFPVLLARLKK